ncbi:MAG: hypothetical protein HQL24_01315 [Candidatus Omnitrophica bacterium]|nr:hypothetical protein [Candidatus Omnitrophota bacterium]
MMNFIRESKRGTMYRIFSAFIAFSFMLSSIIPASYGQIAPLQAINLPIPGQIVTQSSAYAPAIVKGITINPKNPLQFDFLVDSGENNLQGQALKEESQRLVKYFLTSLTVSEKDLWVNLSPYEKDRIIPENFSQTEMGRDLLAQDYILKQLTSSLMYPEKQIGKDFWARVYEKAQKEFHTTDIPTDTFHKIWIVPNKAVVYEKDNSAFVLEAHLKVMLEEDYEALKANSNKANAQTSEKNLVTTQIIKDILVPEIEKEINTGKNFASLRQIYNSMILAAWFKRTLKESLLSKVYVNQSKMKGIDGVTPQIKEGIYNQYLAAFKKGVYNYIREEYNSETQEVIPRKYFSGGFDPKSIFIETDPTLTVATPKTVDSTMLKEARKIAGIISDVKVNLADAGPAANVGLATAKKDKAMTTANAALIEADKNSGLFSDAQKKAFDVLSQIGESELVDAFYALNPTPEQKKAFLDTVLKLNRLYPGGLDEYLRKGKDLLTKAEKNINPMEGYTDPTQPPVEDFTDMNSPYFKDMTAVGLKTVNKTIFAMPAGGLGTRLGFNGPTKLAIILDLLVMKMYIEDYAEKILALQKRSNAINGEKQEIPLVLMTSDSNHTGTIKLLTEKNNLGMNGLTVLDAAKGDHVIFDNVRQKLIVYDGNNQEKGELKQIVIFKQEDVASMKGYDGRLYIDAKKKNIATAPHNHGDIHLLMYQTGLAQAYKDAGKKETMFFQDTNGEVFNGVLPILGAVVTKKYKMGFSVFGLKAGDKVGVMARMKNPQGKDVVLNVEYNQQEAVLTPFGKKIEDFKGNINNFVIDQEEYAKILDRIKGVVLNSELVNPKPDTKVSRLETPMQDISREVDGADVGLMLFAPQFNFAATKNDLSNAILATAKGLFSEYMASTEGVHALNARKLFSAAGVDIDVNGEVKYAYERAEGYKAQFGEKGTRILGLPGEEKKDIGPIKKEAIVRGVPYLSAAKIAFASGFAVTPEELKKKVHGGKISNHSMLYVNGENIYLNNLDLDGTLIIKARDDQELTINNLKVVNEGYAIVPVTMADQGLEEYISMRGYQLDQHGKIKMIDITDRPAGSYVINSDGEIKKADQAMMTEQEAMTELSAIEQAVTNGKLEDMTQRIMDLGDALNDSPKSFKDYDNFKDFMIRKLEAAEKIAAAALGNEALKNQIVQDTLEKIKRKLGADKPGNIEGQADFNKIKKNLSVWLDAANNIPAYIRQGIIKAMLEGRIADIMDSYISQIEFGTAGVRGTVLNSKYDFIVKHEMRKFQKDPRAVVLTGPANYNIVTTIEQTLALVKLTKSLQDLLTKNPNDERIKKLDPEYIQALKNNRFTISYDSRINGEYFGKIIAAVGILNGINIDMFDSPSGVPALVWAANGEGFGILDDGGSIFGILNSASHSEYNYNGFKSFLAYLMAQVDAYSKKLIKEARKGVVLSEMPFHLLEGNWRANVEDVFKSANKYNAELRWLGHKDAQAGLEYLDKHLVDFYTTYFQLVRSKAISEKYLSAEERAKALAARGDVTIRFSAFSGVGAEFARTLDKDGQDILVEAGNFPKFFRDSGFTNLRTVAKYTKIMDGMFDGFEAPDPGIPKGWYAVALASLLEEAGEDFENIEAAVNKFNEEDLWEGVDPDVDRYGGAIKLPAGVKGNIKAGFIKIVENYINSLKIDDAAKAAMKQRVFAALEKMNDKLLLTANEAWTMLIFYSLSIAHQNGKLDKNTLYTIEKSHVTTDGLQRVAKYFRALGYKIYVIDTWVGFTELGATARLAFDLAKGGVQKNAVAMKEALAKLKAMNPEEYVDPSNPEDTFYKFVQRTIDLLEKSLARTLSSDENATLLSNLEALSKIENIAGVEESNGYGEMGKLDAKTLKIVDKHISDKDGGLAGFKFADLLAIGKSRGKDPYDMYQDVIRELGQVSTFNNQIRYAGFEGTKQKFGTMETLEKYFLLAIQQRLDKGEDVYLFNGRYKVKSLVTYRAFKYDKFYRGLPEEGTRLYVEVRDASGKNLGDAIITYRPSGTGDSNRVYNWFLGVKPKADENFDDYFRRNNDIVANLNKDFFGVDADIEQDFKTGDVSGYVDRPVNEFYGLAFAIKEAFRRGYTRAQSAGAFEEIRIPLAKALGESTPITFSPGLENLIAAVKAYTFADRLEQNWDRMSSTERKENLDIFENARARNFQEWQTYLDSPEFKEYLAQTKDTNKITITFGLEGKTQTIQIPKAVVMGLKTGLADYLIQALEKAGVDLPAVVKEDSYLQSNDGEIVRMVRSRIEEGWPADNALMVQTNDSANRDKAMAIDPVGGIDLNSSYLDMQIKRDNNGVPLPLKMQPLQNMHIEGFVPVIINITPVENFPALLGVNEEKEKPEKLS